ncbi:MAG TPA: hypothetical protein VGH49_03910 [Xanthobacteraceae bacterium]
MSTKSRIAALAGVLTILSVPAFAGDQDTATLLQDSGRYVPQVTVPSGAYASAQNLAHAKTVIVSPNATDFQLGGR